MINLLKAVYCCKAWGNKHPGGLIVECISSISWVSLLVILGGMCGVAVNSGLFTESSIELLAIGVTLLVVLLKDADYNFIRPLCPLISHRLMAVFRILSSIVSINNVILVCLLAPFNFVLHGHLDTFDIFAFYFLLNICISLIILELEPIFIRFKHAKTISLLFVVLYCSVIVIFRTTDYHISLYAHLGLMANIILILAILIFVIASYLLLKENYPEQYNKGTTLIHIHQNYKTRRTILSMVGVILKQYLRCPAYKRIFSSTFVLLLLGALLCKNDLEYFGAALFIGAYSMSVLQYSTSALSKFPDLLFSAPFSYRDFLYAFFLINAIISSLLCLIISLYVKFVAENSILPILSIWGLICGPLSNIVLICTVFPIKIDFWAKNPDLNRTPVQVFIAIISGFLVLLSALLVQFKTVEASIILGLISFVSCFTIPKHISSLEAKIKQRKYIIIKSLR